MTVRFDGAACVLTITRPARGVVVVSFSGHDVDEIETALEIFDAALAQSVSDRSAR